MLFQFSLDVNNLKNHAMYSDGNVDSESASSYPEGLSAWLLADSKQPGTGENADRLSPRESASESVREKD